ncbi:MAG: hypothetical protein A2284_05685 [Deltaproteobacteria bacterium RIFOXYA12_FULL_61_11]|nr:MAG: hypothetical protein A2284_05685 [Deltaproteobacteria bacterium RIFOXYA12_FULL_61_11]
MTRRREEKRLRPMVERRQAASGESEDDCFVDHYEFCPPPGVTAQPQPTPVPAGEGASKSTGEPDEVERGSSISPL